MAFLPPEENLPFPEDAIEVGRILGPWGIKGAFRVQPFAADPQALFASHTWFVKPAEGGQTPPGAAAARAAMGAGLPPTLKVTQAREQGDSIVATAHEVPDRDTAELLKGVRIFVSRASFPAARDDEFYWVDLIGLDVATRAGVALGRVVGLIETGPHCVIRVRPVAAVATGGAAEEPAADEVLIPFVDAYVDSVDMPGRRIVVDWDLDY